ncbi:hypothetical protein KY362_07855 [Candidatus Woesearchaeota archaeon]|nr:hypothetical protein [Candidatus Woesearchaeota archaeon]
MTYNKAMYKSREHAEAIFAVMDELGISERLTQAVKETYDQRYCQPEVPRNSRTIGRYFYRILTEVLPDSFLTLHKERLAEVNSEPYKRQFTHWIRKPAHKGDKSIYHKLPDKRVMEVIKNGGFDISNSKPAERTSTSNLERKLSGQGIYCTATEEYDHLTQTPHEAIFVFPAEYIERPSTLCLDVEVSPSLVFGFDGAGDFQVESRNIEIILESLGHEYLKWKDEEEWTLGETIFFAKCAVANAMGFVISPEALLQYPSDTEVVLERKDLMPDMLLVEEEPEYYLDEMQGGWLAHVPVVEQSRIVDAVHEAYGPDFAEKKYDSTYRAKFVEGVKSGKIDIDKYKGTPTEMQ